MSKQLSNKKNTATKGEHYTNLMLVTVVEAMVLLIGQLLLYNGFSIAWAAAAMWNYVVPVLFIAAVAVTAVTAVLIYKKNTMRLWSVLSFAVYVALLTALMRYIPNQYSAALGKYIVNSLRGQKIGVITSVIYIAVKFIYYFYASGKAEKQEKHKK